MDNVMSNATDTVSVKVNAGEFQPYDATKPPADIAGYRIVKCTYKQSEKAKQQGIDKRDNVFTYVPDYIDSQLDSHMAELREYIIGYLQNMEDAKIKDQHKNGVTRIFTEYLNLPNLIDYLEEKEVGARLTGEKIAAWFHNECDPVTLHLSESGLDETKILAVLAAYSKNLQTLASGRTVLPEHKIQQLQKCLGMLEDSAMKFKLQDRLEKMNHSKDDLLDLLQ